MVLFLSLLSYFYGIMTKSAMSLAERNVHIYIKQFVFWKNIASEEFIFGNGRILCNRRVMN